MNLSHCGRFNRYSSLHSSSLFTWYAAACLAVCHRRCMRSSGIRLLILRSCHRTSPDSYNVDSAIFYAAHASNDIRTHTASVNDVLGRMNIQDNLLLKPTTVTPLIFFEMEASTVRVQRSSYYAVRIMRGAHCAIWLQWSSDKHIPRCLNGRVHGPKSIWFTAWDFTWRKKKFQTMQSDSSDS